MPEESQFRSGGEFRTAQLFAKAFEFAGKIGVAATTIYGGYLVLSNNFDSFNIMTLGGMLVFDATALITSKVIQESIEHPNSDNGQQG